MTSTPGSKLFDLVIEARAEELLKDMEACSPDTRSEMSKAAQDEALMTALTALEADPEALPLSRVIYSRAKEIFFARSTIKN